MQRNEKERELIRLMVGLYCAKNHHQKNVCGECRELLDYAHKKLTSCKMNHQKTTCRKCPIHCYNPEMRAKIRKVMRFSGPRLIIYRPLDVLRHILK